MNTHVTYNVNSISKKSNTVQYKAACKALEEMKE